MHRDDIAQALQNRKKAEELLRVSRQARRELHLALEKLGSARNWGIWDLLGGGLISGLMKHSRIDDAMGYVERAKENLRVLGQQLEQVHLDYDIESGIGGFAQFADLFMDGLFADFYIQSKIGQLHDDISNVLAQLDSIDEALERVIRYEADRSTT